MNTGDTYDLRRFVDAQEPVFERVCAELRAGQKQSHWMWFIFPQIQGLGRSSVAERFAISSLAEAKAYGHHEILGPRLRECTRLVNLVERHSAGEIFGYPDDLKFHSSMSLFCLLYTSPRPCLDSAPERKTAGRATQSDRSRPEPVRCPRRWPGAPPCSPKFAWSRRSSSRRRRSLLCVARCPARVEGFHQWCSSRCKPESRSRLSDQSVRKGYIVGEPWAAAIVAARLGRVKVLACRFSYRLCADFRSSYHKHATEHRAADLGWSLDSGCWSALYIA